MRKIDWIPQTNIHRASAVSLENFQGRIDTFLQINLILVLVTHTIQDSFLIKLLVIIQIQ